MEVTREITLNAARPDDPAEFTIAANRLLTDPKSPNMTRHIVLDLSGTSLEGVCEAGQAIGIIPQWDREIEENQTHILSEDRTLRLYSLASPTKGEEGKGKLVSIPVKRLITEHEESGKLFLGACSNYLCDAAVGDTVQVTGPTGKQLLLPDPEERAHHRYVFLATGTGIAPFRGMVRDLLDEGVESDIWLILGVPYSTDILYGEELSDLARTHEHFHFLTAISREQRTADGRKRYVQEVLRERPETFGPLLRDDRTLVYVCGLEGMETGIWQALIGLGAAGYLAFPEDACEPDPAEARDLDRSLLEHVRPRRGRAFVEVY